METRIWSSVHERVALMPGLRVDVAAILGLRGDEVYTLRIAGPGIKDRVGGIAEELLAGVDPREVGGELETLDVRSIERASVSPGGGSLELVASDGTSLSHVALDSDADDILAAILARTGREFRPAREGISISEAAMPPAIIGLVGALFWLLILDAAKARARGREAGIRGARRGLQGLIDMLADALGHNGALAVGALLGAAAISWLVARVVKRPRRAVWTPI